MCGITDDGYKLINEIPASIALEGYTPSELIETDVVVHFGRKILVSRIRRTSFLWLA
jgi:hypothetical protein